MPSRRREPLRLSRAVLDAYRAKVDSAADAAGSYVMDAMEVFFRTFPDASTEGARNAVIEIMETALPNFCDQAETISADFFDEIAEALGVEAESQLHGTMDYSRVGEKVRYFARFLNGGDERRFKEGVAGVTRFFVKRSAFANMVENCRGQEVRWARVPSGLETCAFCFMLSSRGFVYETRRTASEAKRTGGSYHDHCDCIAVPGFQGPDGDPRVEIEGYDPQTMYENWLACGRTVGVDHGAEGFKGWTDAERRKVMREVETRDWHWLYTGEVPEVRFQSASVEDDVTSNRPHEVETAKLIAQHGITTTFVRDYEVYVDDDGEKRRRGRADLVNGVELKTLGVDEKKSASTYNTINGYIKRSSKKKRNMRILIFDNSQNRGMSDEKLAEHILRSCAFGRGRIYILDHDGNYRFIR